MKVGNFHPAADPNIVGGADVVITDKETGAEILFRVSVGIKRTSGEHYLVWPKCQVHGITQSGVKVLSNAETFSHRLVKKIVHESVGQDDRFLLGEDEVV